MGSASSASDGRNWPILLFSSSGIGCQALRDHPCRVHGSLRGRGKPSASWHRVTLADQCCKRSAHIEPCEKSDDLATAIVPAATSHPLVMRELGCAPLLKQRPCRPTTGSTYHPSTCGAESQRACARRRPSPFAGQRERCPEPIHPSHRRVISVTAVDARRRVAAESVPVDPTLPNRRVNAHQIAVAQAAEKAVIRDLDHVPSGCEES